EGDEKGLFAQDTEWVRQTPIIFVEPHDWMLPKQSTVRNFLSLMASQERDILVQHENIVAVAHELGERCATRRAPVRLATQKASSEAGSARAIRQTAFPTGASSLHACH